VLAMITAHAREGFGRRLRERRAHAQHRQSSCSPSSASGPTSRSAAPPDLDRGPAQEDAVLHHALQDGLGAPRHPPRHRKTSSCRSARCSSRSLKRDPRKLAAVAFWLLLRTPRSTSTGSSCDLSAPTAFRSTGRRSRAVRGHRSALDRLSASRACAVNTPCGQGSLPRRLSRVQAATMSGRSGQTGAGHAGAARVGRRRRGRRPTTARSSAWAWPPS